MKDLDQIILSIGVGMLELEAAVRVEMSEDEKEKTLFNAIELVGNAYHDLIEMRAKLVQLNCFRFGNG